MPAAVSPSVRKAAADSTLQFDWLLGDRQFWTFKAASGALDVSDSFLEKLWDDARHDLHISGHEYNAGRGARMTKRIARAFLVRLMVKSAKYDAQQKREAMISCAREFNAADCEEIAACFQAMAERKRKAQQSRAES